MNSSLPNPVWSTASGKAKDTTDTQSHVESRSPSNGIRRNAPERSANNQTHKESTGCKPRIGLRYTKLHSKWRQGKSNTLRVVSSYVGTYPKEQVIPATKDYKGMLAMITYTYYKKKEPYLSATQPMPQSTNKPHW